MIKVNLSKSGDNIYIKDASDKVIAWFRDHTKGAVPGKYDFYVDTDEPGRIDLVMMKKVVKRKEK
jgi:hypothetical protein